MNKVVYNKNGVGLDLSQKAIMRLVELTKDPSKGLNWKFQPEKIKRHDPLLIQIVEELGNGSSNDNLLKIKIIKGNKYQIVNTRIGNFFIEEVMDPEEINWVVI